jgi:lipid-A-disaccharide synthase
VIFPFEEDLYRRAGVPVEFVGHPLLDLTNAVPPRDAFLRSVALNPEASTVALLPGSRANEVARLLPVLLEACDRIRVHLPNVQFVVARAPNLDDGLFAGIAAHRRRIVVVERSTDAVLACADVAITASGTATVQASVHGTPMVVVYKLSPLTYRLGRRLVLLDTFAMANLIAGERIVPELIQDECTPESVTRETVSVLTDPERAARMREGLARVRARLGGAGASRRAAEAVIAVMRRH